MKKQKVDKVWGIREKGTTSLWERLVPGTAKPFMLYLLFGNRWEAENFIKTECTQKEQEVLEVTDVDIISQVEE